MFRVWSCTHISGLGKCNDALAHESLMPLERLDWSRSVTLKGWETDQSKPLGVWKPRVRTGQLYKHFTFAVALCPIAVPGGMK